MSLTIQNLKHILSTYGVKEPAASSIIIDMRNSIYSSLVNGERSMLFGVGCIKPKTLKEKSFRNPKTGNITKLEERKTAKLKISEFLKNLLN